MGAVSIAEGVMLAGIAVAVACVTIREARCFWQWKRSVGRLERQERTRVLRMLRDDR